MNEFSELKKSVSNNLSNFKLNPVQAIFTAFIVIVALQLIAAFVTIPFGFIKNLEPLGMPLGFLIGGLSAIFLSITYVKTKWKFIVDHLLNPISLMVLILSVLLFLFMVPFTEYVTSIVPTEGIPILEELYKVMSGHFESMFSNNYRKITGFITVCILAPIIEEILFRGIILRGLLQYGASPIMAIFLSSFLFGLAHLNPWQFLGAGILGAIFGYVYYRTQSLWLPVFLHALNNCISFFFLMKYNSMDVNVTDVDSSTSVTIFFILGLICAWIIYKLTKNKQQWI